MSSVNKVILLGNLGKDPEVRYLDNDRVRASFSLATHETYRNKEGVRTKATEWHNIVLWSSLAKIAEQYLVKGKQVYIEGRLATRSYLDKEGQTKSIVEITGQRLVLLGRGEDQERSRESNDVHEAIIEDGLPF